MLELDPLSVSAARRLMPQLHRRRPKIVGALFATSVLERGELVGIACASEPKAPRSRGKRMVEISRVATNGTRNACSKLYGALCRAAASLGYAKAVTFTDPDEPGTSLRAAGFRDDGLTREQCWDRPSARRKGKAKSAELSQVRRWVRELQAPRAARARARSNLSESRVKAYFPDVKASRRQVLGLGAGRESSVAFAALRPALVRTSDSPHAHGRLNRAAAGVV